MRRVNIRLRRRFKGSPREAPLAQDSLALDAISNEPVEDKDNHSSSCNDCEEAARAQTFRPMVLLEAGSILALNKMFMNAKSIHTPIKGYRASLTKYA